MLHFYSRHFPIKIEKKNYVLRLGCVELYGTFNKKLIIRKRRYFHYYKTFVLTLLSSIVSAVRTDIFALFSLRISVIKLFSVINITLILLMYLIINANTESEQILLR